MKLKQLRKMHGYTQAAFSAKFDIAQNTLSNYERGNRKPDPSWIAKVAQVMKVPADYILDADQICDSRMGRALKEEREVQNYTLKEVSKQTKIPLHDLEDYEEDREPINRYLFLLLCKFYGTTAQEFYIQHDMIDEDIPDWFNGDMEAYLNFKEAHDKDALEETKIFASLSPFSQEDIALLLDFRKLNSFGQEKAISYIRDLTEQYKYTEKESSISEDAGNK